MVRGVAAHIAVVVLQLVEAADNAACVVQKVLPLFRQYQTISLSIEKIAPQILFQTANGAAQTLLGDKQAAGGLRNAAEFADLQKISHLANVHLLLLFCYPARGSPLAGHVLCEKKT